LQTKNTGRFHKVAAGKLKFKRPSWKGGPIGSTAPNSPKKRPRPTGHCPRNLAFSGPAPRSIKKITGGKTTQCGSQESTKEAHYTSLSGIDFPRTGSSRGTAPIRSGHGRDRVKKKFFRGNDMGASVLASHIVVSTQG